MAEMPPICEAADGGVLLLTFFEVLQPCYTETDSNAVKTNADIFK